MRYSLPLAGKGFRVKSVPHSTENRYSLDIPGSKQHSLEHGECPTEGLPMCWGGRRCIGTG